MFGSTFQYVKPTEEQLALMQEFRDKMEKLNEELVEKLPTNRAKSLALTRFEECAMWVNKAITENC